MKLIAKLYCMINLFLYPEGRQFNKEASGFHTYFVNVHDPFNHNAYTTHTRARARITLVDNLR